jgi:adenylate cyclase
MRFRSKVLLTLLPIVLAGQLLVAYLIDKRTDQLIFDTFQESALSIAASTARAISGDAHASLHGVVDESNATYTQIRGVLRGIRDANRRSDTWVKFLYTVMPSPDHPARLLYGVDPEESPDEFSKFGDVVHSKDFQGLSIVTPKAFEHFVEDEYGSWLTGLFPVRDSKGKVVAAVVVEIDSEQVQARMHEFHYVVASILGIGLVVVIAGALLIARYVSVPLERLIEGISRIGGGDLDTEVAIHSRDEFGSAAKALSEMTAGLKERIRVKSAFARYVSHQVADTVLNSSDAIELHGTRKRITVLFCDIRGFTSIAERLPPESIVALLNNYFDRMVDIIFSHGGTIDKFIGDGLMAIFGAPQDDPYQEQHAIAAAIDMRAALQEMSAGVQETYGVDLRIGVGIHSGPAVVGNIGSSKRMDYTAIGDTVNLAARLESATRQHDVDILLSEHTAQGVTGEWRAALTRIGSIKVKGREEEVTCYSINASPNLGEASLASSKER